MNTEGVDKIYSLISMAEIEFEVSGELTWTTSKKLIKALKESLPSNEEKMEEEPIFEKLVKYLKNTHIDKVLKDAKVVDGKYKHVNSCIVSSMLNLFVSYNTCPHCSSEQTFRNAAGYNLKCLKCNYEEYKDHNKN